MGRKIPGKKHRGVKDPFVQQAKRNELLKNKINAAPSNPDVQEVPKSFLEISRLMKMAQEGKFKKKGKKKNPKRHLVSTQKVLGSDPQLPGMTQEDKHLPLLDQKSGESEEGFLERIQVATDELINEAKMESKFNVKVNRNKYGEVERIDMGKLSEPILKKKKKPLNKNIKESIEKKVKRLSKHKRNLLKKKPKEENERTYESIKFGEIVHEPPSIKKLPRGAEKNTRKDKTLLLNSFLGQKATQIKKLSMSMQQKAEKQRQEVVSAYRELKQQRYKKL